MEGIKLACGQITWSRGYPPEGILAEIAQAGYEGAPFDGSTPSTASRVLELFARYRLKPAPGYIGLEWWTTDLKARQLANARRQAAFSRELGLSEIYVASNLTPERRAMSGRVTPSSATPTEELKMLADLLNELGRVTLEEGVSVCFHNHVGSPIETRDEFDRLFALVDRSVIFPGPDLGHFAWAGDNVVGFTRDYASTIKTIHLKDIDPKIRVEGVAQKWDYQGFSNHGIFAELGEGLIDYPAVFRALAGAEFRGWIVVETDVTRKPSALQSATISRNYLQSIGV